MLPHPDTVCQVTHLRRQELLREADLHRRARFAPSEPVGSRAARSIRAVLAGLVAHRRVWWDGRRAAEFGKQLPPV